MASSFYQAVYQVTAQIPAGRVATYGQIAFLAGRPRASRIVGGAMARAPEGLPCHRVIYGDGRLSPPDVFGGPGIQRMLLEAEGVPFLPDGRVDLCRCRWNGAMSSSPLCEQTAELPRTKRRSGRLCHYSVT